MNPRCPGHKGFSTPWCPGHRGFVFLKLFLNFKPTCLQLGHRGFVNPQCPGNPGFTNDKKSARKKRSFAYLCPTMITWCVLITKLLLLGRHELYYHQPGVWVSVRVLVYSVECIIIALLHVNYLFYV